VLGDPWGFPGVFLGFSLVLMGWNPFWWRENLVVLSLVLVLHLPEGLERFATATRLSSGRSVTRWL
jgi:hypothetical protein